MSRRSRAIARPIPTVRRWVTLAAILAFFLQSLAVQTHIHAVSGPGMPPILAQAASVQPLAPAPLKAQDPVDQCRLCHELVQAGAFIAPSVTALPASQLVALVLFALRPAPRAPPVQAFGWQGRAPPRA